MGYVRKDVDNHIPAGTKLYQDKRITEYIKRLD